MASGLTQYCVWCGVSACGIGIAYVLSCVRLCDPMDRSLPGSFVHVILEARILEWGAYFRGSFDPGIKHTSPAALAFAGGFFTTEPPLCVEHELF